jgi:hypothetical protein
MSTVSEHDARGDDSSASAAGYPLSAPFVDSTPAVTPRLRKWYKGYPGTSAYNEYKAWGVKGFFLGFWSPYTINGECRLTWGGRNYKTTHITDMYEPNPDYKCEPQPLDKRTEHCLTVTDTGYLKWLTKDIQDAGGTIIPSVGGATGHLIEQEQDIPPTKEIVTLAVGEYLGGIKNYNTKFLDFDIESRLTDNQRETHIEVLLEIRTQCPDVKLSHTLPINTGGYNDQTLKLLNAMVNHKPKYVPDMIMGMLMEMNVIDDDYFTSAKKCAEWMAKKHQDTFGWSESESWARLGLCPMFGANLGAVKDSRKVTTIAHMQKLVKFAQTHGVATVSGWSANRDYDQNNPDQECEGTQKCSNGPPYPSSCIPFCTLVSQKEAEFSRIAGTYTGKTATN